MAKKNMVHITGYVDKILVNDGNNFMFSVRIRKNPNKFVYPIVELGQYNLDMKEEIVLGRVVEILGKVTTSQRKSDIPCDCGSTIDHKYVFTCITTNKVNVFEATEKETYLNNVILLGTVCNEKQFNYIQGTRSKIGNSKYQVAVNRREPDSADFPYVTTFAKQAEEDAKRINVGSQILVDGNINTRIYTKTTKCENCEREIELSEPHTEILGVSVEYLNNCYFDDKESNE